MDLFDKLALWGRKYEPHLNPRSGDRLFNLSEVLDLFRRNTILELTPYADGKQLPSAAPDPVRKLKVSLLDQGIAPIGAPAGAWYEVFMTAPSGDLARAKVLVLTADGEQGEVQMLIAQRVPDLYFKEDPLLSSLAEDYNAEARRDTP